MEHEHVIELPEIMGESFKVVQIYLERDNQRVPFLPFNHTEQYHADILEDFLKEKNIPCKMKNGLPSLKENGYEVVGMGYLERFKKMFIFSLDSGDDRIGINPEHLEKCKPYFNDNDLEIVIL